jgi:hypothetical protein
MGVSNLQTRKVSGGKNTALETLVDGRNLNSKTITSCAGTALLPKACDLFLKNIKDSRVIAD